MILHDITRINRLDPVMMDTLFNFLKADCTEYRDLDREVFNECDIFVCTGYRDPIKNIKGILGIRRTTMENIKVHKLEYYCQPNGVLYSLEFMHIFDMYPYDSKRAALTDLVEAAVADKNDGFTFFVPKCPITSTEPIYHALEDNNFKLYPYLHNGTAVVMFMRSPRTGSNPHLW